MDKCLKATIINKIRTKIIVDKKFIINATYPQLLYKVQPRFFIHIELYNNYIQLLATSGLSFLLSHLLHFEAPHQSSNFQLFFHRRVLPLYDLFHQILRLFLEETCP